MSKPISLIRKIVVVAISIPIFILGIILIPLPGPGLLVCLLALVVLSLEFESARKYRDAILQKLKDIYEQAKTKAQDKDR